VPSLRFVYRRLGNLQITASLVAQRVFTSMMRIMQPANRGLACRIPCCRSHSGLFSASAVNVREAHGYTRAIQPCNTDLCCIVVTSWHCVLRHKLAINLFIKLKVDRPQPNNEIVDVVVTGQSLINFTIKSYVNKISTKETCSRFRKQSIMFASLFTDRIRSFAYNSPRMWWWLGLLVSLLCCTFTVLNLTKCFYVAVVITVAVVVGLYNWCVC